MENNFKLLPHSTFIWMIKSIAIDYLKTLIKNSYPTNFDKTAWDRIKNSTDKRELYSWWEKEINSYMEERGFH